MAQKLIRPFSKVIYHITNSDGYAFYGSIRNRMKPKITGLVRLKPQFDNFEDKFTGFDQSFKFPLSSPETKKIKLFDVQRGGVFMQIDHAVRDAAKYSVIAEVKEAAEALLPVFDNFAGTPKVDYEGEMANLVNIIQDLEKPENAAHIARLGQSENVAALKQLNLEFQSLYETRFEAKYAHKQEGNSGEWRDKVNVAFDIMCQVIVGLRLSAVDPAELALLDEIVAIINSTVDQYTIIVNRHLGITASKKKDDDDDNEDEGIQKPDTSPTPAPDTSDQNPSDEPHHLDPGEHPAMGE